MPDSPSPMHSFPIKLTTLAAIGALSASAIPSRAEGPPALPPSVTVISPIFGQLVRFSMPSNFVAAHEATKDTFYIREAVLKGETINRWTQMITVTGAKGLAGAPNFSAQGLAGVIAGGFKKNCPDSFDAKGFGTTKLGDQDAYIAVASCGKVETSADKHNETAMIIAVKGATDGYTIQWAERRPSSGPAIDEALWQGRLRELMPIRLCAIVPGEAAPYPSCIGQK
jgi:hypothetical protein